MFTHSKVAPSRCEALELCPCFEYKEFLETDVNDETPAARGTRLHKVLESGNFELCKDEIEREGCCNAQMYIDGVKARYGSCPEVLKEVKLVVRDLIWGTGDIVLLWKDLRKGFIGDFKFIRQDNISAPGENFQLEIYAAGVLEGFDVDEVEAGWVAPLINYAPPTYVYRRSDLSRIYKRIEAVLHRVNDAFKAPTPCDNCSMCANAGRCPALSKDMVTLGRHTGLPMPEQFAPEAMVSAIDRAKAQILARAAANWSEQMLKANGEYLRLNPDTEIPGHSRVCRKGNLKITDMATAINTLRHFMSAEQILGAAKLSLPQLTDTLAALNNQKKDETRAYLEEQLEGCVERGPDIVYLQRKKSVSDRELLGM